MDHGLELFIPILEILEIEVCNILQNPGNIGNWMFLIQPYPGNIGNLIFPIFPYPGNTGNMLFAIFWDFYKKDARRNFTQNAPVNGPRSLI